MDPEAIKAKVEARRAANVMLELLEWPDNHGADFAEAFIDEMRKLLPKRRVVETIEKPVPYQRLASTEMKFGKHAGETFGDIPDDYLDWLCREQESFLRSLQSYLKHSDHRPVETP
jgi:hypothetical protein